MDILLDTQILVWSFDAHSPLSKEYKSILEDVSNRIFVSQISLIELAIKKNINKLPDFVPDMHIVAEQIIKNGFDLLKLTNEHIFAYQHLPLFQEHRDPFDRMLIATAMSDNLAIMTTDAKFYFYSTLIKII